MFLTISTTGTPERPATDLGFLLHKHPDKAQTFSTSHGTAHVFYPEATAERCTAALLLEVDPVALVRRGKGKGRGGAPGRGARAVRQRPAVRGVVAARRRAEHGVRQRAEGRVPGEARAGRASRCRCASRCPRCPRAAAPSWCAALFEPLGWTVDGRTGAAGRAVPRVGRLALRAPACCEGELRLADALRQLYVLLPVLDDAKHYWVAPDEVDKLLRAGEGWLAGHPEQKLITSRYLSRRWSLTRQAMERLELVRLAEADDSEVEELDNAVDETTDATRRRSRRRSPCSAGEAILGGAARRRGRAGCSTWAAARASWCRRCSRTRAFTEIVGVDVSMRALTIAARRLQLDRMGERQAARVTLLPGLAHLHRQAAQGVRRRRAERGRRAPRPAAAARPGVRGVRLGPAPDRRS